MGSVSLEGFGGGGAGLNFKVVGNPQPASPSENTIWVDTDEEITGWCFSATEPETPAEGMVWISTGVSSTVEFNALKKNGITVYPSSAKQYVDGAWVNKTAKSYQNAQWVDWLVRIVPNDSFTWFSNSSTRGTVTKNDDGSITVKCTSNNYYAMGFTEEMFDLTGFNTMTVTYTSTSGYTLAAIGVARETTGIEGYKSYAAYTKVNKTTTPVTAVIDISAINEPVYFGASEFNGSVTVLEIKLEV